MTDLHKQYIIDAKKKIRHTYLPEQFYMSGDYIKIFKEIKRLVATGDYTIGEDVIKFEQKMAKLLGVKYVVGVGNGTDAIFLSLKAIGVKKGDEVITTPYTFIATIGAIVATGATPVFVDILHDYTIDPSQIVQKITTRTKAIIPVHWAGLTCDMEPIMSIANMYNIVVIEDACQAILSSYNGKLAGTFGSFGCFSMHPLKNLNVWGDGGFIAINGDFSYHRLLRLRHHGMTDRNTSSCFGYNSRLDSIQAIVANYVIDNNLQNITSKRISNADIYSQMFKDGRKINPPDQYVDRKHVFHLYIIRIGNRNKLVKYLNDKGIDAKIHYPIPIHLQPASKYLGYKKGDFPEAERVCNEVVSLPVHEYLNLNDLSYVVQTIEKFYEN